MERKEIALDDIGEQISKGLNGYVSKKLSHQEEEFSEEERSVMESYEEGNRLGVSPDEGVR